MTKKPARTLDIRQAGALTATVLIVLGASLARADQRCDDIADQLETNIDGLKVGITAGNIIYLSHPQARELSLGCSGRNFKNELYAKADSRKPKPAFLDLVGSAAAIIFTQPKGNTLAGVTRCINKTEASIAISRHPDE
jgi:hypothetical protein